MAIVYDYVRFSDKPQERGDSLRRQTERLREWLAKHPEHTLDESVTLRDLGKSAFDGTNLDPEKGDLGKFIALARDRKRSLIKPGSYLALEHLDRFSRQPPSKVYPIFCELVNDCGIKILCLTPSERIVDQSNIDDMGVCFEIILLMQMAWRYSQSLSDRVGKAWAAKKQNAANKKVTAAGPCWLRLVGTKDARGRWIECHWEKISERVAVVKEIYRLALDGRSVRGITKQFNGRGVPCISGKSKRWYKQFVHTILTSRTVLGEYQPCTGHDRATRKKAGAPVKGYYPQIIPDDLFYRVQEVLDRRVIQTGPQKTVLNLFTGLLKDARDGRSFAVIRKPRSHVSLVNSDAHQGVKGAVYISFPYHVFERAFLRFASELKASDLSPATTESATLSDHLEAEQGKLRNTNAQLVKLKAAMKKLPDVTVALEAAAELQTEQTTIEGRIERLKQQLHESHSHPLTETQELIATLDGVKGAERDELRRRLRQRIRHVVNEMWLLLDGYPNKAKRAIAQCYFAGGNVGQFVILVRDGIATVSYEIGRRRRLPPILDVRNWREWETGKVWELRQKLAPFPIHEVEPLTGRWSEKVESARHR